MTIVEAMKLRKRLAKKAEDLREKIGKNCAILDINTPLYGADQEKVLCSWLQSHRDIIKKMEEISVAIQKTNIKTDVTIVIDGKEITKSLAAWVLRRRELAPMDLSAWKALGDRGLEDQPYHPAEAPKEIKVAKVLRFFDPKLKDAMVDLFSGEPSRIDAKLEVVNATTELVESVEVNEDELSK